MKKNQHLTVKGNVMDRGQLKWGALMLPEHVRMLREWRDDEPANHKPQLDEEELGLLQEEIALAYQRQCIVELRYWHGRVAIVAGTIISINLSTRTVELSVGGDTKGVAFVDLLGIRLVD